jgi:hypothetical protein
VTNKTGGSVGRRGWVGLSELIIKDENGIEGSNLRTPPKYIRACFQLGFANCSWLVTIVADQVQSLDLISISENRFSRSISSAFRSRL